MLLALFGPKRGVRLEIDEQATLGRSSDADLQLVDGKVSRLHCRFTVRGGRLEVEDLGSHNGTYVNGEKLSAARALAAGDEVAVGDSLFLVDGGADAAAARFGDATLIVTPGGAPAEVARSGAAPPAPEGARLAAAAALAVELAGCRESGVGGARRSGGHGEGAGAEARLRPAVGPRAGARAAAGRAVRGRHRFDLAHRAGSRGAAEAGGRRRGRGRGSRAAAGAQRGAEPAARGRGRAGDGRGRGRRLPSRRSRATAVRGGRRRAARMLRGGVRAGRSPAGRPRRARPAPPPVASGRPARRPGRAVGVSAAWRAALHVADASAAATSTVLITGESGTGKEEIARATCTGGARARADRSSPSTAAAIAETLAESELFGHEKGAFTGATASRAGSIEAADGGTLFLDEVGELPAAIQVKLLRVLQETGVLPRRLDGPRRVDVPLRRRHPPRSRGRRARRAASARTSSTGWR